MRFLGWENQTYSQIIRGGRCQAFIKQHSNIPHFTLSYLPLIPIITFGFRTTLEHELSF